MTRAVPPIIYSMWLQWVDQAPPIVRLNFERWERLNPGYRLKVLEEADVGLRRAFLPRYSKELGPQALSDVVRAYFLMATGGIWVDASVYPAVPLDEWLPSRMTSSGFFAFEKPGPDRPLSSWFLAVGERNPMMQKWWRRIVDYWSVSREPAVERIPDDPVAAVTSWPDRYPYFWFHYLFQALVESDEDFASDWAGCARLSADPPHRLQRRLAQSREIGAEELAALAAVAPVHKLNWRSPYPVEALEAMGRNAEARAKTE